MEYKSAVLNKLIDKYENRSANSNKRVLIKCSKKEIEIPDIESDVYYDFRDNMLELKNRNLIEFDWIRKDYIINSIWLNLENVTEVYNYLGREERKEIIKMIINQIDEALKYIKTEWIKNYLISEKNKIITQNKLSGIWNKENVLLKNILSALMNIDNLKDKTISMRAFSVKIYGDSKLFERKIKKIIVDIIKNNEPDLCDVDEVDEVDEREVLAQAGIIMMPEVFEFCGDIKIEFKNGIVDFSPVKNGSCISSESVMDICRVDISNIQKVLFIENKTNYYEYCLNNKSDDELVIYHGGFYSPQRGEFFYKICYNLNIPVYFWGDIDYGGFKMFVRLKKNIIPALQPYNMDIESYNFYKANGLKRDDDYIIKIKTLLDDLDYNMFKDVICAIIDEKVTVEQESFLED